MAHRKAKKTIAAMLDEVVSGPTAYRWRRLGVALRAAAGLAHDVLPQLVAGQIAYQIAYPSASGKSLTCPQAREKN